MQEEKKNIGFVKRSFPEVVVIDLFEQKHSNNGVTVSFLLRLVAPHAHFHREVYSLLTLTFSLFLSSSKVESISSKKCDIYLYTLYLCKATSQVRGCINKQRRRGLKVAEREAAYTLHRRQKRAAFRRRREERRRAARGCCKCCIYVWWGNRAITGGSSWWGTETFGDRHGLSYPLAVTVPPPPKQTKHTLFHLHLLRWDYLPTSCRDADLFSFLCNACCLFVQCAHTCIFHINERYYGVSNGFYIVIARDGFHSVPRHKNPSNFYHYFLDLTAIPVVW